MLGIRDMERKPNRQQIEYPTVVITCFVLFCLADVLVCVICLLVCSVYVPWQSAWRNLSWKVTLGFHLVRDPCHIFSPVMLSVIHTVTFPNIYRDSIWYINLQRLYIVLKKLIFNHQLWLKIKTMVNNLELLTLLGIVDFASTCQKKNKGIKYF